MQLVRRLVYREELSDINFLHHPKGRTGGGGGGGGGNDYRAYVVLTCLTCVCAGMVSEAPTDVRLFTPHDKSARTHMHPFLAYDWRRLRVYGQKLSKTLFGSVLTYPAGQSCHHHSVL